MCDLVPIILLTRYTLVYLFIFCIFKLILIFFYKLLVRYVFLKFYLIFIMHGLTNLNVGLKTTFYLYNFTIYLLLPIDEKVFLHYVEQQRIS